MIPSRRNISDYAPHRFSLWLWHALKIRESPAAPWATHFRCEDNGSLFGLCHYKIVVFPGTIVMCFAKMQWIQLQHSPHWTCWRTAALPHTRRNTVFYPGVSILFLWHQMGHENIQLTACKHHNLRQDTPKRVKSQLLLISLVVTDRLFLAVPLSMQDSFLVRKEPRTLVKLYETN